MNQNEILINKAQAGDKAATQQLYEAHESYWFRLCLRYGRNRSEAQDIFQEGVVRVFERIDKYDVERGTFKAWSNRVIVNEALKYLKKHQWQQAFEDLEASADRADVSENILDKITAKELTKLIQGLPLGYRMVFNMYAIEGYSHKEIAAALNISVGTSKSQLSKAKKTLRAQIKVLF